MGSAERFSIFHKLKESVTLWAITFGFCWILGVGFWVQAKITLYPKRDSYFLDSSKPLPNSIAVAFPQIPYFPNSVKPLRDHFFKWKQTLNVNFSSSAETMFIIAEAVCSEIQRASPENTVCFPYTIVH